METFFIETFNILNIFQSIPFGAESCVLLRFSLLHDHKNTMIVDTNWCVCPKCYLSASFLMGLTDASTVTLAPHCANRILFARTLKAAEAS